jgi:lipid-binding SYLF domain-containing protein
MRTGLWVSGAGGSGVLLARKEDGSWSPPSGILVHTLGVGFMAGIDIYDCVCVINSRQALDAFSKLRVSLGGEVSVVAGPLGVGGILDSEVTKDRKPVFSYMKSRGLYGGIQLDGTIIIERNDENARFYGERVGVKEILKGNVRSVPPETRMLMEVVKEAEGRTDLDQNVLNQAQGPAPGDLEVENMGRPTTAQQQQYAPPQGYYPPEKTQGTYGASEPTHPYHPGPPDGTSGYYPPPPQQQAHDPNQASSQQAPGQAGYYPPPQYQGQGSNQAPYYPPPPGYSAGASGAPQQAYNPTSYHPQTQASAQTPYFPPPPPGPPPK